MVRTQKKAETLRAVRLREGGTLHLGWRARTLCGNPGDAQDAGSVEAFFAPRGAKAHEGHLRLMPQAGVRRAREPAARELSSGAHPAHLVGRCPRPVLA